MRHLRIPSLFSLLAFLFVAVSVDAEPLKVFADGVSIEQSIVSDQPLAVESVYSISPSYSDVSAIETGFFKEIETGYTVSFIESERGARYKHLDYSLQNSNIMFKRVKTWLLYFKGGFMLRNNVAPAAADRRADAVIVTAKDFAAGQSTLCITTEDGKEIKFYPSDAMTAPNAGAINSGDATTDAVITANRTRILELENALVAQGLLTSR